MSLKDRIFADNANIFLNVNHFAELFTIDYNGEIFENVPAMLTAKLESERKRAQNDHIQGLSIITHTFYCETKIFDRELPHPEEEIKLQNKIGRLNTYYVVSCKDDFGMCKIQLREMYG